jgi:hypothetical protein
MLVFVGAIASPHTMTAPVVDVALRAIIFLRLSVPYTGPRRKNAAAMATRPMLTFAACAGVYLINTRMEKTSLSGVEATTS